MNARRTALSSKGANEQLTVSHVTVKVDCSTTHVSPAGFEVPPIEEYGYNELELSEMNVLFYSVYQTVLLYVANEIFSS